MTNEIKYNFLNTIRQYGGDEKDIVNSRISSLLESPDYKKGYQQAVYDIEFYHKREELPTTKEISSKQEVPTTKEEISSKQEVPTTKEEISSIEEVPISKKEISSKEEVPISEKKISRKQKVPNLINPYPVLKNPFPPNYMNNQMYTIPVNTNYFHNNLQPMPYYEYLPQSNIYNDGYVNNFYGGRLNEKDFDKKSRRIYNIYYN